MKRSFDIEELERLSLPQLEEIYERYLSTRKEYEKQLEDMDPHPLDDDVEDVDEGIDIYDAFERMLDEMEEYLDNMVSYLLAKGLWRDAMMVVLKAYDRIEYDGCSDEYADGDLETSAEFQLGRICESVKEDRNELLETLISINEEESLVPWLRSPAQLLVHDMFNEREQLERIASWYLDSYRVQLGDASLFSAFWKGRLMDIVERMGNDPMWKDILDGIADVNSEDVLLVYAECLSRRGDERCLDIWKRFLDAHQDSRPHDTMSRMVLSSNIRNFRLMYCSADEKEMADDDVIPF